MEMNVIEDNTTKDCVKKATGRIWEGNRWLIGEPSNVPRLETKTVVMHGTSK